MKNPKIESDKKKGTVYLVGAGPGDPRLITERGIELLGRADIVLYDRLVNPSILLHAGEGTELISVGKKPGAGGVTQEAINRRLVREARRGRMVVRLKGGDPILFGRGTEEALHLARERVPFEIVPGVSSATAVPACAGIPLTLRRVSSSVTIVTGHEAARAGGGGVDWDRLLRADSTFVVLMGVKNLEKIVKRFLDAGRDPRLPAALIEAGTTNRQRTVTGPLRRIAALARERGVTPPAILVVGDTVALRKKLKRARPLPLSGVRVLVTRPLHQAGHVARLLEDKGAAPLVCPLIEIKKPRSFTTLDKAIKEIDRCDWIIFTSVNGVRFFMERLHSLGRDARALFPVKVCVIGPATEAELGRWGVRADCRPRTFTSRGVVKALAARRAVKDRLFLLPRSERAGREITTALEEKGGRCVEAVAYRAVASKRGIARAREIIRSGNADLVLLTSPSVVDAYLAAVKGKRKNAAPRAALAAIGPVTAKAARQRGLRIEVEAAVHSDEGMVRALEGHLRARGRSERRSGAVPGLVKKGKRGKVPRITAPSRIH